MKLQCRFEPIVDIATGQIIASEMLCRPEDEDAETFFRHAPLATLSDIVDLQIARLREPSIPQQQAVFINVSLDLLLDDKWADNVLPRMAGYNIELDCLQCMAHLDALTRRGAAIFSKVRRYGINIWLDDINEAAITAISALPLRFDGIKIDKYVLWHLAEINDRRTMADFARQLNELARVVIVEGVENDDHLQFAAVAPIRCAQGYYWPVDGNLSFELEI